MKCFTLYQTYEQLKTEQSMYSFNSSIQWFRFVFLPLGIIRIVGPVNFRKIEGLVSDLNHLEYVLAQGNSCTDTQIMVQIGGVNENVSEAFLGT